MEYIINYFVAAIKAVLAIVGVELGEDFESNIRAMIDGLKGFEPESEEGSIDM